MRNLMVLRGVRTLLTALTLTAACGGGNDPPGGGNNDGTDGGDTTDNCGNVNLIEAIRGWWHVDQTNTSPPNTYEGPASVSPDDPDCRRLIGQFGGDQGGGPPGDACIFLNGRAMILDGQALRVDIQASMGLAGLRYRQTIEGTVLNCGTRMVYAHRRLGCSTLEEAYCSGDYDAVKLTYNCGNGVNLIEVIPGRWRVTQTNTPPPNTNEYTIFVFPDDPDCRKYIMQYLGGDQGGGPPGDACIVIGGLPMILDGHALRIDIQPIMGVEGFDRPWTVEGTVLDCGTRMVYTYRGLGCPALLDEACSHGNYDAEKLP